MTELVITLKWKDKEAKFKGVVAAGEHVAVTILNDDGNGGAFISDTETLRLNVIEPTSGRLLATFPTPVEDGESALEIVPEIDPALRLIGVTIKSIKLTKDDLEEFFEKTLPAVKSSAE